MKHCPNCNWPLRTTEEEARYQWVCKRIDEILGTREGVGLLIQALQNYNYTLAQDYGREAKQLIQERNNLL